MPTTVPIFENVIGAPSGPHRSLTASPTPSEASRAVLLPTTWKMIVMVPVAVSLWATVSGTRSPVSLTRITTNWPGTILRASCGASSVRLIMSRLVSSWRSAMTYTAPPPTSPFPVLQPSRW